MASYTDREIDDFVNEIKTLPLAWETQLKTKVISTTKTWELTVPGSNQYSQADGEVTQNEYKVIIRQNLINNLNFCVIFGLYIREMDRLVNIRRYDGKYHAHTNKVESVMLPVDYHIHKLTYRYQEVNHLADDGYAEVTDKYSDLNEAINLMLSECSFHFSPDQQFPLNGQWIYL